MKAIFFALGFVCSVSAFAESQPKEAKKIATENVSQEEKLKAQVKKADATESELFHANVLDPDLIEEPKPVTLPQVTQEPANQEEAQDILAAAKTKNKQGLALFKKKKFDEANDAFYSATLFDPDNASYHKNYGRSLLGAEDAFSAVYELEFALELSKDTSILGYLAKAYEKSGQVDKALDTYLKASQKGDKTAAKNYQRLKQKPLAVKPSEVTFSGVLTCGGGFESFDRELPDSIQNATIESLFVDANAEPEQDPVLKLIFQ